MIHRSRRKRELTRKGIWIVIGLINLSFGVYLGLIAVEFIEFPPTSYFPFGIGNIVRFMTLFANGNIRITAIIFGLIGMLFIFWSDGRIDKYKRR